MRYFLTTLLYIGSFYSLAQAYSIFSENGKFGLKNKTGEILIPAEYDELGWSEGEFSVITNTTGYKVNNLWGLISTTNQKITKAEYFSLYPANNYIIASKRSPLSLRITTGCLDTTGKTIIPFNYSGLKLNGMRAIVFTLDANLMKYGLIDLSNKPIIPQLYQNIYPIGSLRYAVQNFSNKTALFSENGKQITGFVIDSISNFKNNLAIIYQEGKQGLMNRDGLIAKEPVYREILNHDNQYKGRMSDQWNVLDASNKLIRTIAADTIAKISTNRLKVVTPLGTQMTDHSFNVKGTEKINELHPFQNSLAVFRKNNFVGAMDENGSVVLPAQYDSVIIDKSHLISYTHQGGKKLTVIHNFSGDIISRKTYEHIGPHNGTFFPVMKNGFYGGVDISGHEIIACTYDSLTDFYQNLVAVKFRGHYGVINLQEEWKVIPQANPIQLINTERYFEKTGALTFLKSIEGSIIYFSSNELLLQGDNLVEHISSGGKWTINLNGQIIHRELPPNDQSELIFPSSEGYRGIRRNGRYGFIDDQGRLRIANRYEDIKPFQEGLAAVQIRGKWGYINKDDKIAIQPTFQEVSQFENGRASVKQNGKYGIITHDGKTILDYRYDKLSLLSSKRILITSGQYVGLADEDGHVLLQPKYESIEDLNNGYAIVKQNEKYGLVTLQGISTIPIHYDYLFFEPESNVFFGMLKSAFTDIEL